MTIDCRAVYAAIAGVILAVAPARAADVHWSVDRAHSTLAFSGTQTGAKFVGRFSRFVAEIALDPVHPEAAHIKATVDLASASTGDIQRDTALPERAWFDAAVHPQAVFETTSVRKVADNTYEAEGVLTLRGVAKPLKLSFTLDSAGSTAHARGHADIIRTAFGVGQGPWASSQWVALEVGVDLDIVATRVN